VPVPSSNPINRFCGRGKMNKLIRAIAGLVMGGLAVAAMLPGLATAQQKVLKFIPQADLRILDPIATTAYITRNHGYMVYDTLFAMDAKFQVKPQMVDKWDVSKDGLTYTFTLRDGLKFHDGQPVRSADCIASIERWAKRDALGQKLAESTDAWSAVNDKTFQRALHHARAHRQDRCLQEHR
jgi:peptide/nickel transport system substrate-binding protein